jgi:hypothetical protein
MCDITPFGAIGHVENTRLLDVVDEMSRGDWWLQPLKPTRMMATDVTAVSSVTNVLPKIDARTGT